MLKQVSDRAEFVFAAESERQDTSGDVHIHNNPVSLRLFPQQAITVEEKLQLVKNDHLDVIAQESVDVEKQSTDVADDEVLNETKTSGDTNSPG